MPPLFNVDGFEVGYRRNSVVVIKDFSFSMNKGETVLLLGGNGSGKSTFFRGVVGDPLLYTKGVIEFNGEPLKCNPKDLQNNGIYWVPQQSGAFNELTVAENLKLTATRYSEPDYNRVFGLFPALTNLRHKKAMFLSGGERRMLDLAVVGLLREPNLLFLDEPTASLSDENTDRLLTFIKSMNENGTSLVITTHQRQRFCFYFKSREINIGPVYSEVINDIK